MYLSQDFVSHYIMQRPVWMEELRQNHYLPPFPFFGLIVALAVVATHVIQDGYAPYLSKQLSTYIKSWRAGPGPTYYQHILRASESYMVRAGSTIAFISAYFFFVSQARVLHKT